MFRRLSPLFCALGLLALAPNPALAEEETSLTPWLEYFLALNSTTNEAGGEAVSALNQSQYGLFGLEASQPFARYQTTGSIAFEVVDEEIALYELSGALTRKDVTYKMGFYDPSDVSLGMAYLPFKGDDNYFGVYQAQDRYLGLEFAEVGLSLNLGARTAVHRADEGDDNASASVDRSVLAAFYTGEFDWLSLSFAGVGIQNRLDENKSPSTAALAQGSYAEQALTLGAQFDMDFVVLALQGEQISVKAENLDDAEAETRTNLSLDIPLGDRAGLGLSGMNKTVADGSANPTTTTRSELGYAHLFGPAQIAWMVYSQTTKDEDDGLDATESGAVLGLYLAY